MCLVTTTIIFLVFPDFIMNLMLMHVIPLSKDFYYVSLMLNGIGLVADGIIYIIFYPPVRRIMMRQIRIFFRRNDNMLLERENEELSSM